MQFERKLRHLHDIILLVGKSGTGKTTVANALNANYGLSQIDSFTTRPPRFFGEEGHTFVTDEEFDKLSDVVAYTVFNGYRYCATSEQVDKNDVYVINPSGIEFFKEHYTGDKVVHVVCLNATEFTCRNRMLQRGDAPLKVSERILNDREEFVNVNADIYIDVDEMLPSNIADKIMRYIKWTKVKNTKHNISTTDKI